MGSASINSALQNLKRGVKSRFSAFMRRAVFAKVRSTTVLWSRRLQQSRAVLVADLRAYAARCGIGGAPAMVSCKTLLVFFVERAKASEGSDP